MITKEELAEFQERADKYCAQLLEMSNIATELFRNSNVDSIIRCLVIAIREGPESVDELASACALCAVKAILKEAATL